MTFSPGMRVGKYEVLEHIGSGGMGEVWKARDTTLEREVALKALPDELASDPGRVSRLEREAKLLARLKHPNIAAIHGLGRSDGMSFLELELVEDRTLGEILEAGPASIETALKIAIQIAEALETAHASSIVHRDLKPSNVKVMNDGTVKVLDFGLAKAVSGGATDSLQAPEPTASMSRSGIRGTPAYMSPEQVRGEPVSTQADIWAFGCLLFEMLTGRSAFGQVSPPETLGKILEREPDFEALPADTPPLARRLIRRCLEKEARNRFQHVGDVRIGVEDALSECRRTTQGTADAAGHPSSRRRLVGALAMAVLIAVIGLGAWSIGQRTARQTPGEIVRVVLPAFDLLAPHPYGTQHLAISNDGSRIAYAAWTDLLVRGLSDGSTTRIDVNPTAANPFFSPDGRWLAFASGSGLYKVPTTGGVPELITESTGRPAGASWGTDGTIVFATATGLYAVPDDASSPARLLAQPDRDAGERLYAWPQHLPDGKSVLFTFVPESLAAARIAVLDLESLEIATVLTRANSGRYVSTGHIVYMSEGELTASAFDAVSLEPRGEPVTIPDVSVAMAPDNGAAEFTVSSNGTLVSIAPSVSVTGLSLVPTWMDREGNAEPLPLAPGSYLYPRVSPDGTRVAYERRLDGNRDIWVYDARRQSQTRLTRSPTEDMLSVWSVDGRRLYFTSDRTGDFDIYSKPSDGSTEARVELARPGFQSAAFFTPDARELIFFEEFTNMSVLDLERAEVTPLLHRESDDVPFDISPDGRWIAYESNDGTGWQVYLRAYPDVMSRRVQVSTDGGRFPKWGPPDSDELYYIGLDGRMMAVTATFSPDPVLGAPVELFELNAPGRGIGGRPYDVSPTDGRFIISRVAPGETVEPLELSIVLNWHEELRKLTAAE